MNMAEEIIENDPFERRLLMNVNKRLKEFFQTTYT